MVQPVVHQHLLAALAQLDSICAITLALAAALIVRLPAARQLLTLVATARLSALIHLAVAGARCRPVRLVLQLPVRLANTCVMGLA